MNGCRTFRRVVLSLMVGLAGVAWLACNDRGSTARVEQAIGTPVIDVSSLNEMELSSSVFAPESLVANPEVAAQLSRLAHDARQHFPQSYEIFTAYAGNPAYARLSAGPLAAGSEAAFTAVVGNSGVPRTSSVGPGRGWGALYSAGMNVSLTGTKYQIEGRTWASPLVLDLKGYGYLGAPDQPWGPHPEKLYGPFAEFDIDGDGFPDVTEWLQKGCGYGLLTSSPQPRSGRDLIGQPGGWKDGFEHLRVVYDTDHNGVVKGDELNGLYVWEDKNGNGVAEEGEVKSAFHRGIVSINVEAEHYQTTFDYQESETEPTTKRFIWDWWPNYMLANRLPDAPSAGAVPPAYLGRDALQGLRASGHPWMNRQATEPAGSVKRPFTVSAAEIGSAGVDPQSFSLSLLGRGGRLALGFDQVGTPKSARLVAFYLRPQGGLERTVTVALPFEEVFQMAADLAGRFVLVLGNLGSKLVVADLASGQALPPEGIDLRSIGLRASGMAGYTGTFWFTGWRLDSKGALVEERIWALTPCGFRPGLSLDSLRSHRDQQLRTLYPTGPDSAVYATYSVESAEETLWVAQGSRRDAIGRASAFGGYAAAIDSVAFTYRVGETYHLKVWWADGATADVDTSPEPIFYPFLTPGRGAVVAAKLQMQSPSLEYTMASAEGHWHPAPLATVALGQGKVARGAFAHYSPAGLQLFPLPDRDPPAPVRDPDGNRCQGE